MASTSLAFDVIARDRASKTFDNVGKSANRSSGNLKKWAKVGAVAVAGAAVVAGKALFDMTKMAIEDEKAQVTLAKQLKNSAGATRGQVKATESWISAQGRALGVTDDELRPALGRLVAVTHDVGKAQKLTRLAMDVSAGSGKSLQAVTTALAKAQTGNVAGLSRLGVATKNADGSTRSLKAITEDLSKTYKGQASAAANTTEGKFGRLKLMFDETKESIGAKLIPVALKLADWMFKFAPTVSRVASELGDKLGPAFSVIGGFIADKLAPALRDLAGKWLEGVRGMFKNVGQSMQDNKPFLDQVVAGLKKLGEIIVSKVLPALGWVYSKAFPLLGTAIGTAITGLKKATTAFLFLGEWGVKAFGFLLGAAMSTFSGILHAADTGLGWIPGIGGKIHDASVAFDKFKDRTVAALKKTAEKLHDVRDAINGVKSPPPIKIDVKADFSTLARFQGAINGLHGKEFNIYAHLLTSGKSTKTATSAGIGIPGGNANGTGFFRGGLTSIHEQGPEIVDLPRGTRIYPAGRSAQMVRDASSGGLSKADVEDAFYRALCRLPIVRLPNAGRAAYQAGAAY